MPLCLLLILALCGLLARPVQAQAKPGDSLAVESPVIRVAKKLGAGVLGGVLSAGLFSVLPTSDDPFVEINAAFQMALLGEMVGAAFCVSWVDPRDRWMLTWGGSVAGWLVGRMGLKRDYWPLIYGPIAGAIIGSELWRKPPQDTQDSRVSVSLGPASKGGLSAVATLRF